MPVVFSPGEPETRPLRPTEIVYTTAQKVADLLGIGPQEEVLVAADSPPPLGENRKVIITGADYRNHGFEVGDTIYVYSDNDPLGFNATIDSISSLSSGVILTFNDSYTAGKSYTDYTVALNTYVQNQASFTNGKTRGVKRSHVEQRIKEVQDRIDNVTHNAWRPYLVSAEYLNFDTYKPYRRRYFTDYVGTTPLLFRNIQQILRIEMWQGDDYREIGSAEARLEIIDHEGLSGDSLYFSLGNGSIATLSVGTGTTNWRADFDKVSTAQNLADLINKEDRVGKAAVDFSPTFTLEGSTSNIAVHNEVLASANADYGNGKLKLTSMRQTKGGEALQIASTDLTNLTVSQIASRSTETVLGYHSTGLTALSNPLEVLSYPAPDGTLTIGGYLAGFTYITLESGANDPSTVFSIGDTVYTPDGDVMGVILLFGGGAGAYNIFFEEAIPSGSRPAVGTVIHDFKKVNLAALNAPIANGGYLASGDSSPIFNSAGETYGTVTAAADGGSPSLTFSAPVTKLDAGTELFNRKYFRTSGAGTHTFSPGDDIFDSDGTKVGTFSSYDGTNIRLSDTSDYTGVLFYAGVRSSGGATDIYVQSTTEFPSKGLLMIVNGASTRVFSYTGKTDTTFTGVAAVGGGAILTQLDTVGTELTQYYFQSDIGAFSDAGGDQARLKDWWLDHEMGIIYFNNSYPFFEWNAVKVSYIYGERYVEQAIEEAATKLVAVDLLMADDRSVLLPEGSQNIPLSEKATMWKQEAEAIIKRYIEVVVFE